MSAEILRKAASEMRNWAEQATPGRWKLWGMTVMADQDGTSNYATAVAVAQTHYRDENNKPRTFDAEHIRGMHPAVALAVADWLDETAGDWDRGPCDAVGHACNHCEYHPADLAALAVARAYLGESA